MVDSLALAEKVATIAAECLVPAQAMMVGKKWTPEFRKIMWEAIAETAKAYAAESK